jgi:hypothetical protein
LLPLSPTRATQRCRETPGQATSIKQPALALGGLALDPAIRHNDHLQETREDIMPRIVLALVLCCAAMHGAAAAAGTAKAANEGLASCLDPSTTLLAGGDVGDKELMAAQNACARLKQSSSDSHTIARINAAAANIADELRRRQTSKQ